MRLHQMWDDFVVFVTGGYPHGPPARPDTNKLADSIDSAPLPKSAGAATTAVNGPVDTTLSKIVANAADDASQKAFVQRAQTRVFVATDALQVLRLQAEQTNLQMQTHFVPAYPPGFK